MSGKETNTAGAGAYLNKSDLLIQQVIMVGRRVLTARRFFCLYPESRHFRRLCIAGEISQKLPKHFVIPIDNYTFALPKIAFAKPGINPKTEKIRGN
jgi:hypothetical protein